MCQSKDGKSVRRSCKTSAGMLVAAVPFSQAVVWKAVSLLKMRLNGMLWTKDANNNPHTSSVCFLGRPKSREMGGMSFWNSPRSTPSVFYIEWFYAAILKWCMCTLLHRYSHDSSILVVCFCYCFFKLTNFDFKTFTLKVAALNMPCCLATSINLTYWCEESYYY